MKGNICDVDKLDIDKLEKESTGLKSLESKVNKLHVDKLTPVPVDSKKLSDLVEKKVVKKTIYDESVKKANAIKTTDTIDLVKKADYNTKNGNIEIYTTTQEFNKFMADNFPARLVQGKLTPKDNIADFVKRNHILMKTYKY